MTGEKCFLECPIYVKKASTFPKFFELLAPVCC